MRVIAYVDGYNMYHAVKKIRDPNSRQRDPSLKWLDLWKLCNRYVPPKTGTFVAVHYFSAYADWLPPQKARHVAYVEALQARGVTTHLANFKTKDRRCPPCGHEYQGHEEKETDVHMALSIFRDAMTDVYDRAMIVSRDSDLVPAAKATKAAFPHKDLRVVAPPGLGHSNEMLAICDGKFKVKQKHIKDSLLPQSLDGGRIVRPSEYDPPLNHT